MKRTLTLAVAALVAASSLAAQPAAPTGVTLPQYSEVALPNGATLLLMEKRDVPLVSFTALIRGGSIADPAGKEGLASLTADLLKKGAGKRNAAQFAEAVDSSGAILNTNATREAVVIQGQFLTRDIDLMTELLSDLLRRPSFPESELLKERDRAVDSLRAAKDADLRSLIGNYANAFLYGDHPYSKPPIGTEATLSKLTRADVQSYYRNNFGGDRLILAVAGDFDAAALGGKLRAALGDWPKAAAPLPTVNAFSAAKGRRVLLVDKPDATQTYFWIGNVGVSRGDKETAAIDLANTVFGGRFTSLLNTALRIESGLTYGARSAMGRYAQPGPVGISSYTKTESTGEAVDLALKVLARYHETGMDDATLASAKSYVLGQFPPDLETASQLAARLAEIELYGLDRSDVDAYGKNISAATRADITRTIARVYPKAENLTFVFIGQADAIRDTVKKYGPVTEMKITDPSFTP